MTSLYFFGLQQFYALGCGNEGYVRQRIGLRLLLLRLPFVPKSDPPDAQPILLHKVQLFLVPFIWNREDKARCCACIATSYLFEIPFMPFGDWANFVLRAEDRVELR